MFESTIFCRTMPMFNTTIIAWITNGLIEPSKLVAEELGILLDRNL